MVPSKEGRIFNIGYWFIGYFLRIFTPRLRLGLCTHPGLREMSVFHRLGAVHVSLLANMCVF